MQDTEMTWKQRYDRMKKHYRWTDADIAQITGNTAKSVNTVINRSFPGWAKLAVVQFETENGLVAIHDEQS